MHEKYKKEHSNRTRITQKRKVFNKYHKSDKERKRKRGREREIKANNQQSEIERKHIYNNKLKKSSISTCIMLSNATA